MANITKEVFNTPVNDCSTGFLWLGSICYSLQLFFDFAGYSDIAIGLTEMFGYSCMENFKYPYMTESVSKFWRRWHISLSEWFRDYIYIPLGGSRNKHKILVYFNLFVVWVLTGIWHGAAWNFIWWGLGYFVLISFERLTGLPERFSTILGKVLYRIFTLLFINFQWVMFNSKDINTGLDFIKHMLVYQNNELANLRAIFLFKDYLFFILIAIVFCFPVVPWVRNKLVGKEVASKTFDILENTIIFISFLWAISFIIAGQNNPYLRLQYLFTYLGQDKLTSESVTVDYLENEFSSKIYMKNKYLNLNGAMAGALGMQGFYSDLGIYVTDDNYIVSPSAYTTTDYEYEQTVAFRDFLEENGIQFLYVNEPTKYVDDNLFYKEFGIETYSNRNADKFLNRIREANINTLDIRDNIKSEGLNVQDMFYRTDHHWTVPAGLWATKHIA